jgi:hypothetical protein
MLRAATAFLGAVLLISTAAAIEKRVALVMGQRGLRQCRQAF